MTHRDSVHPTSATQGARIEQLQWVERQWREGAGAIAQYPRLALALGLVVTLAPSKNVLVDTLATISPEHWDHRRCVLSIPAEQPATHERSLEARYELVMPRSLKRPIRRFLNGWPVLGQLRKDSPRMLSAPGYREWAARRREYLSHALEHDLHQWLKSIGGPGRLSLAVLCRTAPQMLVSRGMPGELAFMLQRSPLPTTSATPVLRDDPRAQEPMINGASVERRQAYSNLQIGSDEQTFIPDENLAERDPWLVDAVTRCVRRWREVLIAIGQGEHEGEWDIETALGQAQQDLAAIEGIRGSFAEFMLLWIGHMAGVRKGPKPSSVRTYTNRLLRPGLLASPVALSMADWDSDDVVDAIELVSEDKPHWAPSTYAHFLQTLAFFVSFVQRLGYAEQATVPGAGFAAQASTYRQAVLGPRHVDVMIEQALSEADSAGDAPASEFYQQIAVVVMLAFYGGLRSSEIRSLTLADVIREADETPAFDSDTLRAVLGHQPLRGSPDSTAAQSHDLVYINVLRGKTPAARRRAALHAMAPERWLVRLARYVASRAEQSNRRRYDRIPLLPPLVSDDTNVDPIAAARDWVSRFYGSQRDLHGLRHSAASYHFLRIAALRDPTLIERLIDRDHPIFSEASLAALRRELEHPQGELVWKRGLAEHWLSRTLGHSQLDTTMKTYVHTLSVVHSRFIVGF